MESDLVRAVEIGASAVAEDFSLWGLFLQADVIVKAVIVVLLIASLWSWAIIFDKSPPLRPRPPPRRRVRAGLLVRRLPRSALRRSLH